MFLRIITKKGSNTTTYECDKATIKPVDGTFEKINVEALKVSHTSDGIIGTPLIDDEFECKDLEVIMMNSDGKTIDRRFWE